MSKNDRLELILSILQRRKLISIKELQGQTYSSKSTLRRDLMSLEQANKVRRTYGQVKLVGPKNTEPSYRFRQKERVAQKRHIARLAASFISDHQTLFLDSSSTTAEILPYLKDFQDLTVITNGLFNALSLDKLPNVQTFINGGRLLLGSGSILGAFEKELVQNHPVDLMFLSCSVLDAAGIYMASEEQASIKRKMIKFSKKTILLCDSSKFNQMNYFKLGDYTPIQYLITEKAPDQDFARVLEMAGTQLLF